jgi:hypothetical protein
MGMSIFTEGRKLGDVIAPAKPNGVVTLTKRGVKVGAVIVTVLPTR